MTRRVNSVRQTGGGKLGLYPPPCGEGRPPERSEGGRGGGGAVTHEYRLITTTPTPNPSPAEVGFTRLRPVLGTEPAQARVRWGGEHTECAA